ncbi:MAG: YraN family protein [Acidipropionibacterium sp.]|jgi:putative endonuclease|nr:YraN family protein [Acidipropionibacterium sp.]
MSDTPSPEPDPAAVTTRRGAALRARGGRRARLGAWGEDVAAAHLRALGWQVAARNWACELGEIDIVAIEPAPRPGADDVVVLVEVRCRSGAGYGDPLESITAAKARTLRRLAQAWLAAGSRWVPEIRIDAIGVLRRGDGPPVITHVRGIS